MTSFHAPSSLPAPTESCYRIPVFTIVAPNPLSTPGPLPSFGLEKGSESGPAGIEIEVGNVGTVCEDENEAIEEKRNQVEWKKSTPRV